jgi:hypothetical protein
MADDGIPPLLSPQLPTVNTQTLMTQDDPSVTALAQQQGNIWGLYDQSMNPVVLADSVVKVSFKGDAAISDAPIEDGGFGSYNKVQIPFDARIVFAKSGTSADRTAFLSAIDAAKKSTNLCGVVTPDVTYASANVVRYDYDREARNGATLLLVAVYVREVRIAANASFTSVNSQNAGQGPVATPPSQAQQTLFPQQPSGAGPVNTGTVQPFTAPQQLQQAPTYSSSGFGAPASTFSNSPFQ